MKHYFLGILFLVTTYAYSQENKPVENKTDTIKTVIKAKDSTNLKDLFSKSQLEIHARSIFMNTINEGELKDDYALASGIGIGITTKSFHGFQFGISSFVFYNLLSSDLNQLDKTTLGTNRYETGLFDIQNTKSKNNLIRLENLFLKYNLSKSSITVGKMKLNTPFINAQDGRMNTTLEEGVWLSINELKKIQISGGWLWNISPRSTTQWLTATNSVGIYPSGINENGTKSNYLGNINSSGIAIGNFIITPNKKIKINLSDMLFDNVMNTSMIEVNTEFGKNLKYYQGAMFIHQDAINNGGNLDQSKTYINKGSQSNSISAQIGIKNKRFNTSLNYTHITSDGRYLVPREWGRDPFYTFMQRERNDGFGNVNAITAKTSFLFFKEKLKTGLTYGYFQLPDVTDYRLNKYGLPSYHQLNIDLSYSFSKFLKGLDVRFLAAYKIKQGETYNNLKYVYNKVNMINLNFILDFKI
jgi:hypothetical protein